MNKLVAGVAQIDVTPDKPLHLYGYPHVDRISTGVHDPLLASALYLHSDTGDALFVSVDVIFISKAIAARVRRRVAAETGVDERAMVVSATHTHSGPGTVQYLSNEADSTVPPPDEGFLQKLEDGIVQAACDAIDAARPAEVGLVIADGSCTGGNRRDPFGPSNPRVPVLAVRDADDKRYLALMLVCSMHPTVLHEDSTVISGDFPRAARRYLQKHVVGEHCPVLHHCGACGNQSPRHVINDTTMVEAERIGNELGRAVETALAAISFVDATEITHAWADVDLPLREFIGEQEALRALAKAKARFKALQQSSAPRADVRTAECDVFGAEETFTLAKAAAKGRIAAYTESCMPAEVQCIRIGPWKFVALPGELFVEFGLAIESESPDTFVITLANGELQGYVVTEASVAEGGYEASNAMFRSPESGDILVQTTRNLIRQMSPSA